MLMNAPKLVEDGWQIFCGGDTAWRELVSQVEDDASYLHSPGWANHMLNMGWTVGRWYYSRDGQILACVQGVYRKIIPQVGVVWFADWIVGEFKSGRDLQSVLCDTLNLTFVYARFRCRKVFDVDQFIFLEQTGWNRPLVRIGAGLTMDLEIKETRAAQLATASRTWRRYTKKAEMLPIEITPQQCPEKIGAIYQDLKSKKFLRSSQIFSIKQIQSLMTSFGDDLLVLGAVNAAGELLAIRGCIFHGSMATDIFAASSLSSKDTHISYRLLFELIDVCRSRNCQVYDLNGIDPKSTAGVYQFKKATGAAARAFLGEYEWSNSRILKSVINAFYYFTQKLKNFNLFRPKRFS